MHRERWNSKETSCIQQLKYKYVKLFCAWVLFMYLCVYILVFS